MGDRHLAVITAHTSEFCPENKQVQVGIIKFDLSLFFLIFLVYQHKEGHASRLEMILCFHLNIPGRGIYESCDLAASKFIKKIR